MILTRKMLAEHDATPMYAGLTEKRYLCPSEECKDKPADNSHRCLTVRDDGVFSCFRCGMRGKLDVDSNLFRKQEFFSRHPKATVKDVMR